jgi:hypothetical protein
MPIQKEEWTQSSGVIENLFFINVAKHGSKECSIDTTTFIVAAKTRNLFAIKDTSWAKRIRFVLTTILFKVFLIANPFSKWIKTCHPLSFHGFCSKYDGTEKWLTFAAVKPSMVKCASFVAAWF